MLISILFLFHGIESNETLFSSHQILFYFTQESRLFYSIPSKNHLFRFLEGFHSILGNINNRDNAAVTIRVVKKCHLRKELYMGNFLSKDKKGNSNFSDTQKTMFKNGNPRIANELKQCTLYIFSVKVSVFRYPDRNRTDNNQP